MEKINEVLKQKIEKSISLLKKGEKLALQLDPSNGYYVAFSGGKDSQAIYYLCKLAQVKHAAYYNVTTIDPPENVYYIRNNYHDVIMVHPKKNFFRLVEEKGLPLRQHRYCCERLKEVNGAGHVVVLGVRKQESRKRAKYDEVMVRSRRKEHADKKRKYDVVQMAEVEHQCIKGKDSVNINPILDWKEKEVWEFLSYMNAPKNPCYNDDGRVGCIFCPFAKARIRRMYIHKYPRFYRLFLRSVERYKNKSETLNKYTAEEIVDWWLSNKSMKSYFSNNKQLELNL